MSDSVAPWTVAHQAPLSMEFSRQEYCRGLLCASSGHRPDSGTEPASLISPALAGGFFTTSVTWEAHITFCYKVFSSIMSKKNNVHTLIKRCFLAKKC